MRLKIYKLSTNTIKTIRYLTNLNNWKWKPTSKRILVIASVFVKESLVMVQLWNCCRRSRVRWDEPWSVDDQSIGLRVVSSDKLMHRWWHWSSQDDGCLYKKPIFRKRNKSFHLYSISHTSIEYFNIQVFAVTLLAIGDQLRAEDTKLRQTYYIWF